MAKGKKTAATKGDRPYVQKTVSGRITGRMACLAEVPRHFPGAFGAYRPGPVTARPESIVPVAAPPREPPAVTEVRGLLDRWYREGKISEVESVHLGLLDDQPHLEVVYWVPENLWLEGGHYPLYRALRQMQQGGLVITPTAFPKQVERAG